MKKIWFLLSLVLLIAWITGAFVFKASYLIHVLLLLALLSWMQSLITRDNRPPAVG